MMLSKDDIAGMEARSHAARIAALCLLGLSALQMLSTALVLALFGDGADAQLFGAGFALFGATAAAVALGLRKIAEPSWRHWLIVAFFALPALASILLR